MINKNEKTTLGNMLRKLRLKAGYTQQNLADALNINRSTYTYYETGKTTPDIHTLKSLAQILDVPVHSLLEEEVVSMFSDANSRRPRRIIRDNPHKIGDLSSKEKSVIALMRSLSPEETDEWVEELKQKFDMDDLEF
ncbi:helix-turn-helix transcriptional regulator [Scatolibacter rhodanostii]|uniref:helix-turn-helix transcriptional regulator n=1 Tax=Scatolibacter rhodanostii TaxID=2014781 RepID=UPI0013562A15|nr:helix-turn-helix domain-containing protein [Scatolibacter rhodanostii]